MRRVRRWTSSKARKQQIFPGQLVGWIPNVLRCAFRFLGKNTVCFLTAMFDFNGDWGTSEKSLKGWFRIWVASGGA